MTKILIISDTHGIHPPIDTLPAADLFIHAGDIMNSGREFGEIAWFNSWLKDVPVPKLKRLICLGNHDIAFDETHSASNARIAGLARKLLTEGILVQDEAVQIHELKLYFSPWSPRFFDWGFQVDRGESAAKTWAKIPDDTEILVTHGPPYGILDQAKLGESEHVGCEELSKRVKELKNLKYHIFGHIHGSRGTLTENGVTFINASYLNEKYRPYPGLGYFLLTEI